MIELSQYFEYGNKARSDIISTSTFNAIITGERTATTRFPMWYKNNPDQLNTIKSLLPDQVICFRDTRNNIANTSKILVRVLSSDISNNQIKLYEKNSNITELLPNQIFVFGSNTEGRHGRGAANKALKNFGAINGITKGLQGQSYAIITKDLNRKKVSLDFIESQIKDLYYHAELNKHLEYLVTPIGTGLAGFSIDQIRKLFFKYDLPKNINLPGCFLYPELVNLKGATYAISKQKLESDSLFLQRWSRLEGWSEQAGLDFFSKEPTGIGYQFCFKFLEVIK